MPGAHSRAAEELSELVGAAERINRTLVEKARCMLNDAKLLSFWVKWDDPKT